LIPGNNGGATVSARGGPTVTPTVHDSPVTVVEHTVIRYSTPEPPRKPTAPRCSTSAR